MQKTIFLLLLTLSLLACKDDDTSNADFDTAALLNNIGENIIIPRYNILKEESDNLNTQLDNFKNDINANQLNLLREQFKATYLAWQACSTFEFGPAGILSLRTVINTFPTDTTIINQNITNNINDLTSTADYDAIGLPALDYMLYGKFNTDTDFVNYYSNNNNALTYLEVLITKINEDINQVDTEWNSSYIETFKNATGTDVASSLGLLVNEMNLDFESYIRDGKVGIPLGIRSLGVIQLEKAEAYYSDYSLELCLESVEQIQDLFNGVSTEGVNGIGLDDFLDAVKATNGEDNLSDKINTQFDDIIIALEELDSSIPSAIDNNQAQVETVYNEMQQIIVLLKVDLTSNLGILISYQDNDGD